MNLTSSSDLVQFFTSSSPGVRDQPASTIITESAMKFQNQHISTHVLRSTPESVPYEYRTNKDLEWAGFRYQLDQHCRRVRRQDQPVDVDHTAAVLSKVTDDTSWALQYPVQPHAEGSKSSSRSQPDGLMGVIRYMRDSWEHWRVVCLAILSIEELYIFGTMKTGHLLIGLGIALVYRKIRKSETAVKGPKRPDMFEALGRAIGAQTVEMENSTLNRTLKLSTEDFDPLGGHTVWQVIIITFLTGTLSLVTVVGNILVLVSFKINKALKTVNNYYLLSLAFADLTIGTLSMNLYTTYIIMNQWALGPMMCDLWLATDYVASNASVMNLLVISFDRYFSVTRPLTYRAKRTTKRAMVMIGLAWSISFILWAPAILFWQYVVGERTVQPDECYIQFLSEPIITFCTAIAAFYLPMTIMAILFWKIYQETEKRAKDVQGLKASASGTNQKQTQSQGNGSVSGESKTNTQKNLTAILHQMSSQNSQSSYELYLPSSERNNKKDAILPGGVGSRGRCSTFCLQFSSLLAGCHASKRSFNNTNIVDKAEHSSCTCFDNNEVCASGGQRGSEVEADVADPSQTSTVMIMKDTALAKSFASKAKIEINMCRNDKKANEKKAAQTLSAILFAFITTWLPYNIMVLVNTFCQDCIPENLWALGYWLCYVNSTVNPMCYALCNKTFQTTFRDILMCKLNHRKNKTCLHQRQAVAFRMKDPL
ncbi:muscarinic acetylcholine receptor M1-like [Leuresthes tenuis]|uniref:muscarinic acetylcholine receptor M1-like n=1 Tax=Leuresthes tenuis TaxID=355514 RepID=UPI003B5031B6